MNLSIDNVSIHMSAFDRIPIEDITRSYCEQINHHVIMLGGIIVVGYLVLSWIKWWFFNYGYKYAESTYFNNVDVRIYWDDFIKEKMLKFMLGYIALVVFLFWR